MRERLHQKTTIFDGGGAATGGEKRWIQKKLRALYLHGFARAHAAPPKLL
jgi:hypothetical protein